MPEKLKDLSKKNFSVPENNNGKQESTYEAIQTSCMLRMADAMELIAKDYRQLQREYEESEKFRKKYWDMYIVAQKDISYKKGHITRLKNLIKRKYEKEVSND